MPYFLSWLPALACPIGMGAMMWLVMRMSKEPTPPQAAPRREYELPAETSPAAFSPVPRQPSLGRAIWDCIQMCLNWRVLVGLALVAALLGVVAPPLFFAALPVLLILVCPLSMGMMMLRMGNMGRMRKGSEAGSNSCAACQTPVAEPHQSFEQPGGERTPVSPFSGNVSR